MKNNVILYFLYQTVLGRILLKLLVQPRVSNIVAKFLSSGMSKWLINYYIKEYHIDMSDIEIPHNGFHSFHDFFIRKRNKSYYDFKYNDVISPCDGYLTVISIDENSIFHIKNTKFHLEQLLNDTILASKFRYGTAFIFRLTPEKYHRYCYTANGTIIYSRKIDGKLHCVRPIAIAKTPVFIQNSREYQVIKTEEFGMIVQMEVGALLVGKIKNHKWQQKLYVQAGEEKGYFEFGGSTIIMLFQKESICFQKELYERQNKEQEIPVYMGEVIAKGVHKI